MTQVHKTQAKLALHIGTVAREARQTAGLTQEEVAERTRLATEVYGRLERGNMLPSLPTLMRLCRVLKLDANHFLGFSSAQPPEWLTAQATEEEEPLAVRRLVRTVRRLHPRQVAALHIAASVMLPTSAQRAAKQGKTDDTLRTAS